MFRNRLLSTYSRKELEDIFIEECMSLDELATQLFDLESKLAKSKSKNRVIEEQTEATNQPETNISGKDMPKINKKIKKEIKNLLYQIDELDLTLRRVEVTRNEELRELNYFRSFFVFPNKKYRLDDFENHSPIQQKQDVIEELEELFKLSKDWDSKNQYLAAIKLMKLDLDSAISYFEKQNTDDSELIFQEKALKDKISDLDHEILILQEQVDKKKQQKKKMKQRVNELEDKLNQQIENERDHYLQRTALENQIKKLESQLPELDSLQTEINALQNSKLNIKSDIGREKCRIARECGLKIISNNLETMDDDIEIDQMRRNVEKLKSSIKETENIVKNKKEELEKVKTSIKEANDSIQILKIECSGMRDKFYTLYSKCPQNPFEDHKFMYFLYDMMHEGMTLDDVNEVIRQIEILEKKVSYEDQKLSKISKLKKILNKELYEITMAQRERYNDFKDQINYTEVNNIYLYEGQAAVLFTISDIFLALKPQDYVCLKFDFCKNEATTQMFHFSPQIEPMQLLFTCEKSGFVIEVVTNGLSISLLRQNGDVIGSTIVDVTKLAAEQEVFASVQILFHGVNCVCAFHLNAKLLAPL
ncbi:hypothetical protein TVAG_471350 [Trichomonas vaginalis G3]|uniref:RPGR-interacting protein 1 first C2 domain-containing protein n=1 Tax=Trichomonas vaginalis (strain ATCC PRA-98 / G3) TaxID=412133 RepID=A2FPT4_TRIV3|nr:A-type inclusion protein-related family [Trichomonas vaginalis G3]EAX93077.1 hypothetical protein TVAG_471350 [Trichomonas vaginalis G3]KAI5502693.1 A-type inclusion protein-related family [Trichomonas vaginalis G3]|eukprot:XP_001306007.1 hypothetical protein [Trichomonas vaginalis G3]